MTGKADPWHPKNLPNYFCENSMKNKIEEFCEWSGEKLLLLDGFDNAIIGIGHKFNDASIVYSKSKIIEKLCQDMTDEEALEYFDFNIAGAYVGENTPFILNDYDF